MGVMVGDQEGSCHKDRGGFFPGPEVVSMIRFEPNDKNLIPHLRAPPHTSTCAKPTPLCVSTCSWKQNCEISPTVLAHG